MKVIIFGCGQGGQAVHSWLPASARLLAFSDNNPAAWSSDGEVPVIPPDRIPALAPDLVWIAIRNREAAESVQEQLRKLGYDGPVRLLTQRRFRRGAEPPVSGSKAVSVRHFPGLSGAGPARGVPQRSRFSLGRRVSGYRCRPGPVTSSTPGAGCYLPRPFPGFPSGIPSRLRAGPSGSGSLRTHTAGAPDLLAAAVAGRRDSGSRLPQPAVSGSRRSRARILRRPGPYAPSASGPAWQRGPDQTGRKEFCT